MKKYFACLILTVCVMITAVLPVAAGEYWPLYDEPDFLTDAEETALIEKLEAIGSQNRMEVVAAVVESTGGYSPMAYADDFYDYNGYGYGYGDSRDGLILVIVMDTRDWWISTSGAAVSVFTDAGIDYIGEQIVPYLSAGDYYGAFDEYADLCSAFMAQAQNGEAYDYYNLPGMDLSFKPGSALLVSLVIGLIIGLIYTGSLKSQMQTVRAQSRASEYVKNGSLKLSDSRDIFLYRRVSKTARETSTSGGSRTHRSSSGRSHGGGGGKF